MPCLVVIMPLAVSQHTTQNKKATIMLPNKNPIVTRYFPGQSPIVPTIGTRSARVARGSLYCHLSFLVTFSLLLLASLPSVKAATVQVLVGENGRLRFTPASVSIQVGDTVQWVWSAGRHSTTSGTPGAPNGTWDSGVTNHVGFTFSHTFSTAGSFPYFCTPHGACCGMTGNVAVSMPTPTPTPPLPLIKKGAIKLTFSTVASGLTAPLEVTSAADGSGRLFIVQQTGQIRILKNGNFLATPFLNVAGRMVNLMPDYDERGLLGFAFHPDFNNPSAPGFHK